MGDAKEQVEAATPATNIKAEDNAPSTEDAQTESVVDTPGDTPSEAARNAENVETEPAFNGSAPKNGRKFDASQLPVTDDPQLIRTQAEFYFNDCNLPTDKFLWEKTGGEENKPVSLKVLCTFNRMKRFQPYSAVVAALKDSEFLEVTGEEGEEAVKRKRAYVSNPNGMKKRMDKSVYIKGFGEETATTQFDIENWLTKFGQVDRVKLRREGGNNKGPFKGSAFVEFHTEEIAKAFVVRDPPPTWNDQDLVIMLKADYVAEKTRAINAGEIEPSKYPQKSFYEGREKGARQGARGRGGHNGRDERRRDNNQKNGFKGGRGGRGRGRGGRGRGGRGRDEREVAPKSTNNVAPPMIQSTNENGDVVGKSSATNGKRAREADGGQGPPAKKVDTKIDVATT